MHFKCVPFMSENGDSNSNSHNNTKVQDFWSLWRVSWSYNVTFFFSIEKICHNVTWVYSVGKVAKKRYIFILLPNYFLNFMRVGWFYFH